MSILVRYNKAVEEKDENALNGILHDDFKFTLHSSGKVILKSELINWAMTDDINREKVRIIYENDEIGVEHSIVNFKDGNKQAVMAICKYQDGKIISLETGATNMSK
ncbi:MAG: hypothetical protein CFH19_00041 [Alphaproteobacteria bacterium MarineAlpha5_Bin9]|nr:MAG: hypothetical protein CFH19_00041 [Alphaproteobacteria bacterium MarineAlpha5_Bin9]|tara:strand:- start:353 stop:673 length:321 start_codon:yes stop_codon:yes gene_type:complete